MFYSVCIVLYRALFHTRRDREGWGEGCGAGSVGWCWLSKHRSLEIHWCQPRGEHLELYLCSYCRRPGQSESQMDRQYDQASVGTTLNTSASH